MPFSITIVNANFETPILSDDTIITFATVANPIPGWTLYDPTGIITRADITAENYADVGTWNPPQAAYPKETMWLSSIFRPRRVRLTE
jgi:hypothetical protein